MLSRDEGRGVQDVNSDLTSIYKRNYISNFVYFKIRPYKKIS